ncbi:MAG: ribosomal L7Ae/L30e/S12e/Gadd45 family protein [Clostridia bacterium]|nr:ribosomal L7Ae/L30e/S12e/Gadd45 family protein [Clostridia bacterium]
MTTPDKLGGLLGIARRAGQLAVGFDAAAAAVTNGDSRLILVCTDLSPKTEKECRFVGSAHRADVLPLPYDKAALARLIGAAKPVGVVAVCGQNFEKAIRLAL